MQEFDEYHGTKIIKTEAEALLDLELQLGEIPVKPPIDPYKSDFGFVVLDGCIRQLSLDETGFTIFSRFYRSPRRTPNIKCRR